MPQDAGQARGWLFTIARNCLLNNGRSDARRGAFQRRYARAAIPVAPPADENVGQLDFAAAWNRLSPANQEVLTLTAVDELTSQQAGEVLGIAATVYPHRLAKARKALRRELERAAILIPENFSTPIRAG